MKKFKDILTQIVKEQYNSSNIKLRMIYDNNILVNVDVKVYSESGAYKQFMGGYLFTSEIASFNRELKLKALGI